jgi:hypothetical protein
LSNFRRLIKHSIKDYISTIHSYSSNISLKNLAPPCTQILDYKQTRLTLISFF